MVIVMALIVIIDIPFKITMLTIFIISAHVYTCAYVCISTRIREHVTCTVCVCYINVHTCG